MSMLLFGLILGDGILALLAFATALMLRFGPSQAMEALSGYPQGGIMLRVMVLLLVSYIFELYDPAVNRLRRQLAANVMIAVFISFVVLSILFFIFPQLVVGRGVLALSLITFMICQFFWHTVYSRLFDHPLLAERIFIVGRGRLAERIGSLVEAMKFDGNSVLAGYLSCVEEQEPPVVPASAVAGDAGDIVALAEQERVSRIIVALLEKDGASSLHNVLLNCKFRGIDIVDCPTYYEQTTGKLMLENMDSSWLIYSTGFRRTTLVTVVKRIIDICLALIGLILVLPLVPLIALLVKLNARGPVLFSQVRVGQWEKHFQLYKFRTMGENAERDTGAIWAKADDPRVGPIGRFLRVCRIDEIPQLYNVLKGEMSFIGPRPERPEFVEKLDRVIPFYAKRHFIKPGITGWAQVKYPYGASVEEAYEKLRYDLYYIKNLSPLLDTMILLLTIKVVLLRRGGR
jgi:sugar transferase (PEP-CTERM system associated)